MFNYKTKAFIWEMIAVCSVLLGVLGSMSAWESGNISFIRMLVQSVFFGAFAYTAFGTATTMRRACRTAARRRRNVVRHPAVACTNRPAVRAA